MSHFTALPTAIPAAVLETILMRLAALFLTGAGGDLTAARHAAAQMLAAHNPETPDELRLAANIIAFSFQSLEALAQASDPELPVTRILRLRGSAVTLSRESQKAERRLMQLQKARCEATSIQPEPIEPEPKIEKALNLISETNTVSAAAKATGKTWTQAYEERQREARIAANVKKAEAIAAAHAARELTPAAPPTAP